MGKSYKPSLIVADYEREREEKRAMPQSIHQQLQQHIKDAAKKGVAFHVRHQGRGRWTITVDGESGALTDIPTAHLAEIVHGLYLMGTRLRRWRMGRLWDTM